MMTKESVGISLIILTIVTPFAGMIVHFFGWFELGLCALFIAYGS